MTILLRRFAVLFAVASMAATVAACGGDAAPAPVEGGREVTHAMGSTTVPEQPARVVVLDSQELDAALSLGVTPVGATSATADGALPSYLEGKVPDGIAPVGAMTTPDLEAIAALAPDLILSSKVRHESLYPQLSAIAPTVFAEQTGAAWKDNLRLYATALNKEGEATELLDAYTARAAALGERAGAAERTVSVVRFMTDEIRLYGPRSFVGSVLADAGFARPDNVRDEQEIAVSIGPEQVGSADADVVYATAYGLSGDEPFAQVAPLWATLPAVREGRAHTVDDDAWMLAIGPTGAGMILDDLERTLG